ncbi:ABC transporter permease [Chryseolinea lacunae]|uniref:ABC transporter permease n=1 Tax=Chryseolinea lacunae TaxID=2801331 RepID=A0ABS1KT39_9BACT|nr:ABC transporter permease [Chryseolinea lacunae]MBL0742586.1 ABC transporter permease [Chryseolinea lacunae]
MLLHLLKIDLKKLTSYRTFWVVCGLYFITIGFSTASGMEFLKWLASLIDNFGQKINIERIPLYHFPDVWLNLVWWSGFFKVLVGIMVVISISNEYTYRTLRQNIIDGLSRWEFLLSKILTNLLLSVLSVVLIFFIALITGFIYTPEINWSYVFTDLEFYPAYLLEVFSYLSFALMLGILVQRSGLTIILLLLAHLLEFIIKTNVDNYVEWLIPYFPMESISALIKMPLYRYAFQQIQDYVDPLSVVIATAWMVAFNYISYLKLKRSDL